MHMPHEALCSLTHSYKQAWACLWACPDLRPQDHPAGPAAGLCSSSKAKALRALVHGQQQALAQLLLGLVLQQVQLVEAGVCAGEPVHSSVGLVDLEPLGPRNALQPQSRCWAAGPACSGAVIQDGPPT